MEKILSIVAIIISVLTLVFGGYVNGSWDKEIKKAKTLIQIESISYLYKSSDLREIVIPTDLQKRSKKSRYVPTLDEKVSIEKIKEIIDGADDAQSAVKHFRLLQQRISSDTIISSDLSKLWMESVSTKDKALIFSVRTKKILKENFSKLLLDPETAKKLMDDVINKSDDKKNIKTSFKDGLRNSALREGAKIIFKLEYSPTKELMRSVISNNIDELEVYAYEFNRVASELKDIQSSSNKEEQEELVWEINLNLYNSGSVPDIFLPISAMAIQRLSSDNNVILFEPNDTNKYIYIEPKKLYNIKYISKYSNDKNLIKSLLEIYNSGDRDFRVILKKVSGEYVFTKSERLSSSTKISVIYEKEIKDYSKNIKI